MICPHKLLRSWLKRERPLSRSFEMATVYENILLKWDTVWEVNRTVHGFKKAGFKRKILVLPISLLNRSHYGNPKCVGSNPPVLVFLLLFFSAVLLYCCCTVVHTWWVRGLVVVDGFICCVLCFTVVHTHRGWMGGLIGTSTTHVAHHSENPRQASYCETSSCLAYTQTDMLESGGLTI